jgi:phospholipase/carboxylesterase
MLHGAGGTGNHAMHLIADVADTHGVAVVAPDSEGQTWDLLGGGFGGDAAYIAEVLSAVGREAPIDPAHLAIGGFSDGASYALSLGLTNGDLFTHVIAFSPGFMAPGDRTGTPQVYLSHGTHDTVLPIDRCSRRIVPALRGQGYEVTYREFEGPHTVPETISHEAMTWLLAE